MPNIGITSAPVYDPKSGTAYFTAKVNDGPDVDHPHWYMHAIDITTGTERDGFPTKIEGSPSNDPGRTFDPKTAMQRPGLLLLDGVVYAGFGGHCDIQPYVGYLVGVNATTGRQTTMWATEAGPANSEAGIWQSGGGLVSDGPGQIIVTTGNGVSPPVGPGKTPPKTLAESVIRLKVNDDGNLTPTDFFSPANNALLDRDDIDFGSGGPMAIPNGYGTTAHPHPLVQVGKDGRVFLLDRDDLGGAGQGLNRKDPAVPEDAVKPIGPYKGVWGHPAFWGGDGGYVYTIHNDGPLTAFKIGASTDGTPTLTEAGNSTSNWGYTSGSPIVTSDKTNSGSALVWGIYSTGPTGAGAQLRAYNAIPQAGVLTQRYSSPLGNVSKFAVPATDNGRVFVGTRDGLLYGFGHPSTAALSGTPTDFGSVAVNKSVTKVVTLTATRGVTVTAVNTASSFTVAPVKLPVTLAQGQKLQIRATFKPTAAGAVSDALSIVTDTGTLGFDLRGSGTKPGLGHGRSEIVDHGVSRRMVKGRSVLRVAQRVASAMSLRPARRIAPTARLRRVAMTLGPDLVWTLESSSR